MLNHSRFERAEFVAIVEPWFAPGVLRQGPGAERFAQIGDLAVTRKAFTRIDGRTSVLEFTYIIDELGSSRTVSENHSLGLFTRDEMLQCFDRAGLSVHYLEHGLTGRGLYLARAPQE